MIVLPTREGCTSQYTGQTMYLIQVTEYQIALGTSMDSFKFVINCAGPRPDIYLTLAP